MKWSLLKVKEYKVVEYKPRRLFLCCSKPSPSSHSFPPLAPGRVCWAHNITFPEVAHAGIQWWWSAACLLLFTDSTFMWLWVSSCLLEQFIIIALHQESQVSVAAVTSYNCLTVRKARRDLCAYMGEQRFQSLFSRNFKQLWKIPGIDLWHGL